MRGGNNAFFRIVNHRSPKHQKDAYMGVDHPHYLAHRQWLRRRSLRHGLEGFADYEVVELLLTFQVYDVEV
jgi:hypothetical protein